MPSATTPSHPLPPPFTDSAEPFELVARGAEALLYRTIFLTPTTQCALKVRPAKRWRHPTLDKRLTRQRILAEARVLVKCVREGVAVPAVLGLDWEQGWMAMEWIEGGSVKAAIRARDITASTAEEDLRALMRRIGCAVGKLHAAGLIHGDLTTSNMMLRPAVPAAISVLGGEIVLIDFGLATQAVQEEDRAVDLYVLERAFGSTHPREEHMFPEVLVGYSGAFKGAKGALRKLEEVRMRGRKRSMVG